MKVSPLIVVIPEIETPPCGWIVTPDPTLNFAPSNVKLASSSSSPLDPAITTLLSVRSAIAAVSAARVSIFAVPSMNRFCHSLPAAPMFLLPWYQVLDYYQ